MTLQSWSPAVLLPSLLGPVAAGGTLLALGPSSRCCATASSPSTAGSPRASSWTPSPWD